MIFSNCHEVFDFLSVSHSNYALTNRTRLWGMMLPPFQLWPHSRDSPRLLHVTSRGLILLLPRPLAIILKRGLATQQMMIVLSKPVGFVANVLQQAQAEGMTA